MIDGFELPNLELADAARLYRAASSAVVYPLVPGPSVHTRQSLRVVATEGIGFTAYRAIRRMSFKSRSGRRGGQVRRCGFPRLFRFFQASRAR